MDEIRCPMCGNLNPPELEECQYCQARLTPLIMSQPPEEDLGEDEGTLPTSGEEEGLPEWLQDLRMEEEGDSDQDSAEAEGETPFEENGEADWLARLQDQSLTGDEESEAEEPKAKPFGEEFSPSQLDEAEPGVGSVIDKEELAPDRSEADIALSAGLESFEEDELPEWLSDISPTTELTDQEEAGLQVPQQESPSHEEETLPDWMVELEPEEPQESPDWVPEVGIHIQAVESEEEDDEDIPEADDEAAEEEPDGPATEEEHPEWLKGIEEDRAERVPPFEEMAEEEVDEPKVDKAELPDWMVDLETDEIEEEEVEELPDWLVETEAEPELAEPELEEKEELPDWLAPTEAEEGKVEAIQDEVPDWMDDLEAEEIEETTESAAEDVVEGFEEEEVPEWLTELEQESVSAFVIDEKDEEELTGEDLQLTADEKGEEILEPLPEWADDVSVDEEVEGAEELELEEAELPSWLEAMRPVEAVAPDISAKEPGEGVVETIGPLAGLRGILAAETDFARVRKPPTYAVKLRVTENQQARVTLLKEMLSTEDKQKALPAQPVITPQYIFRLVIALALILPILWAVVSGGTLTPLPEPENVPSGVLDVRTQIESQLSTNSPVLIAFDYEAGFSSELDIPASTVISHMMDKGAYLTLVSTTPSGPILAERLIDKLNQISTRQENPYTSYSNMGYVPGGDTGLLSLAQTPKETVPYSLDNIVVWESSPLNLVSTVADFDMVLVVTENPETARAWIEQVQPFLKINETPMIMVLSAQAEPLVRPYYDGTPKQINGLIVGLPGGAAYESVTGQEGLARRSWDAFSLSVLVAELILIVGAVVGLGGLLMNSTKKEED